MSKINTKRMVQVAMLIAVEIVLSRFLSIPTPITKISFAFLPVAIIAMLYGPVYAGIAAALADFIGAMLFPTAPFFAGFTLTAFLTGVIYGLFLHKQPDSAFYQKHGRIYSFFSAMRRHLPNIRIFNDKQYKPYLRVLCAVLLITFALHLGLNTVWIKIITGKAILAFLPARLVQSSIMLPVQVISIYAVVKQSSRISALAA